MVTSKNREDIIAEFKHQLQLTSTHCSINKNAWDKATKLYNDVERIFQFKEATATFLEWIKRSCSTNDGHKIELSSIRNTSSVSSHSTTLFTGHDSESSFNVKKTSNEAEHNSTNPNNNQIVYENIQLLSTHDQDVNNPEIDSIIVDKIPDLIFSNLNLEEIWDKVMERLKQENLSIKSRIVDLSNWKKVDWDRILETSDYVQLFNGSKKNLYAQLTAGVIEFFHLCLQREVNILVMQPQERDYIVKILSSIIGFIFEEFDVGTFELNWIEKNCRSVTCRKRKFVHEEYMELEPPLKKMDLIISLRSYKVELLVLEAGNTEGPMDDTKFWQDHSKIKIVMKDCLDSFWNKLHFKKNELKEMVTLTLPTILSEMEDLLPDFLENLLALWHTQIELVAKIRKFSQKSLSTPSPPSSPLHKTTVSPLKIQKLKKDPFCILDNLY
nr:9951_t:CDS:10 [Entrophospora candida]